MVLGIVGQKHAGKDTFARFIVKHRPDATILHYADRLKDICETVFPVSNHALYDPVAKEENFELPIVIDQYIPELEIELGFALPARDLSAKNARELLQFLGTDYVRATHPAYWTDYLKNKIETQYASPDRFVIVADVRFQNEAEICTAFPDGVVMRITRTSGIKTEDQHASEKQQQEIICPTLSVVEGDFDFIELVATMMALDQTEKAFKLCV